MTPPTMREHTEHENLIKAIGQLLVDQGLDTQVSCYGYLSFISVSTLTNQFHILIDTTTGLLEVGPDGIQGSNRAKHFLLSDPSVFDTIISYVKNYIVPQDESTQSISAKLDWRNRTRS